MTNMTNAHNLISLPTTLQTLADICEGDIIGRGDVRVESICSIDDIKAYGLTFVTSPAVAKKITDADDVFYIVKSDWREQVQNGICHPNPEQALRQILVALTARNQPATIAPTAIVSDSAMLGENVSIGAHSVIGDNVRIGDNVHIGIGVVIEENTQIGNHARIGHRVVIHHDTQIGSGGVISEGAVIAGQGFGFSLEGGQWKPIPQIGRVIIGDNVHIGANSCIDRGAINDTIIGNHVIIDNLVHIAHNVQVGDGTAMAAGVGIAGSTKVGKYCLLAGQVGVVGHIKIADGVQVNGGARVLQPIKESGVYAGSFHVQPVRKWNRTAVYLKKLGELFRGNK